MSNKKVSIDKILDDLEAQRLADQNEIPSEEFLDDNYLLGWRFVDVGVMQEERPAIKENQPESFYRIMALAK